MFLTPDIARSLIELIASFLTYFWLIPLLGYFRAWVAKKMGDNTPEMLGYLTLDPFMHMDMIGLMALIFFRAGWGKNIPIYLNNIHGRYPTVKRLCALFSDAFLSFVVAVITVIMILSILGYNYTQFITAGNQPPSMVLVAFELLKVTLRLSMFLMLINLVNNFATFIIWWFSKRALFYNPYVQIFLLFVPLFIFILFGNFLFRSLFIGVEYVGLSVIRLFGM